MYEQLKKNVYEAIKLSGVPVVHHSHYFKYLISYPSPKNTSINKVAIELSENPTLKDICAVALGAKEYEADEAWLIIPDNFIDKDSVGLSHFSKKHNVQVLKASQFLLKFIRDFSYLTTFNDLKEPLYILGGTRRLEVLINDNRDDLLLAKVHKYIYRKQLLLKEPEEEFDVIVTKYSEKLINETRTRALESDNIYRFPIIYFKKPSFGTLLSHVKLLNGEEITRVLDIKSNNVWLESNDYYSNIDELRQSWLTL